MSVINTNVLALNSQNNLTKSQGALGTAIERLSSGMRINSAKDDAAGQAIANRFTANIKGLTQATRNANDGISIAQTTEGSLNEINDNLQRIRELTVQAANGSNSGTDLKSIQDEITQRLAEIDRVSEQTQFNGVTVLGEDAAKLSVQVGAHDGQTIDIELSKINSKTLELNGFSVQRDVKLNLSEELGAAQASVTSTNLNISASGLAGVASGGTGYAATGFVTNNTTGQLYATLINAGSTRYAAISTGQINASTGVVSLTLSSGLLLTSAGTGSTTAVSAGAPYQVREAAAAVPGLGSLTGVPSGATIHRLLDKEGAATDTYVIKDGDKFYAATATENTTDPANVDITAKTVSFTTDDGAQNSLVSLGGADGETEYVTIGDQRYEASFVDGKDFSKLTGDPKLLEGKELVNPTANPLEALDSALQKVDDLRSHLGAIQNRFESTIANLSNTTTNLSAARSRIEDADYAVEVSNMTRAQILQQAGTSVLAQANQVPQSVLSLLG